MKAQSTGPVFSAVFVDYDNIYLSLKRKNEEAAKRFAKDAAVWLREIESGRLIRPTTSGFEVGARRIVMNRCYGNPVPRRNASDNSTDMNSFPFVRHHFLRAGFEVVDCPPLTAQLKNSADIRMVMDVRDYLGHETRFEEFILLSGDADFTPVLHRLRAHARRTVVFANDHTAAPYTALSDGEVREHDLISFLLDGQMPTQTDGNAETGLISSAELQIVRRDIVNEIIGSVRTAGQPVPLEALADRAVRSLGHDKTVGSSWGGAGSFRDLLSKELPDDIRLSDQPPYYVFDASRQMAAPAVSATRAETRRELPHYEPSREAHLERAAAPAAPSAGRGSMPASGAPAARPATLQTPMDQSYMPPRPPSNAMTADALSASPAYTPPPLARTSPPPAPPPARGNEGTSSIQQSIARIHEACQAPPLAPPEYRALFEVMAEEINTNNLAGSQTLLNIVQRARDMGVEIRRDDVRFVLEVVSEPDPWFEQGASANLFASRFRNFVVARCRSQGLNLSADELDLIEAWFGGSPAAQRAPSQGYARNATQQEPQLGSAPSTQPYAQSNGKPAPQGDRWWSLDEGRQHVAEGRSAGGAYEEEFPRIVKNRLRG